MEVQPLPGGPARPREQDPRGRKGGGALLGRVVLQSFDGSFAALRTSRSGSSAAARWSGSSALRSPSPPSDDAAASRTIPSASFASTAPSFATVRSDRNLPSMVTANTRTIHSESSAPTMRRSTESSKRNSPTANSADDRTSASGSWSGARHGPRAPHPNDALRSPRRSAPVRALRPRARGRDSTRDHGDEARHVACVHELIDLALLLEQRHGNSPPGGRRQLSLGPCILWGLSSPFGRILTMRPISAPAS